MQARLCGTALPKVHWEMVKEASRTPSAYQFYFLFDLYFLPEPLLQKIWRKKQKQKFLFFSSHPVLHVKKEETSERLQGCDKEKGEPK